MNQEIKEQLAHVLWIGGATDAGKSTVAQGLADRYDLQVYFYDRTDVEHHNKLAEKDSKVRKNTEMSLDERWVHPTPQAILERTLNSFSMRFPLLIEDILALPANKPIIVEGFGLLPELVHPMLSDHHQAIWFIPTEKFKWESMERRGKPSFAAKTSDSEKARNNLFKRDMLLADIYREQVPKYGYVLYEVNGSRSVEEMTELTKMHFANYLEALR